jgi:hypothetical protein
MSCTTSISLAQDDSACALGLLSYVWEGNDPRNRTELARVWSPSCTP